MPLISITSTSQTGTFELLAAQLASPPGLVNNSGSTITISLTATGQCALLNIKTSDPNLVKYTKLVDGDGHVRDKNDEKYAFKYPKLNPGALVGEIKDATGNTKSTVSGKQQSFELQPGETVSFVINDDTRWYGDNTGKLSISYTSTVKSVEPIKPIEPTPTEPKPIGPIQFEVKAKENSTSGGVPLQTGISVAIGDFLTIKVSPDDTWSAGAASNLTSNANGLGNPLGKDVPLITKNGFSFLSGSLVGSLDDGKTFFPVGTRLELTILVPGRLSLFYWDQNNHDNSGSVTATVVLYKGPVF